MDTISAKAHAVDMGAMSEQDYARMLDLTVALLDDPNPRSAWPLITGELTRSIHAVAGAY